MSVKRAAEEHAVPRSTLQHRILGNVVYGTKPGAKLYLNQAEEEELSEYYSYCRKDRLRKQIKISQKTVAVEKEVLAKD